MFESLSGWLIDLGLSLIPFSVIFFPILRLFEYSFNSKTRISRLIKSIWYFDIGLMYLLNIVGVNVVVTAVCFIECFDLFFQHFEEIKRQKGK